MLTKLISLFEILGCKYDWRYSLGYCKKENSFVIYHAMGKMLNKIQTISLKNSTEMTSFTVGPGKRADVSFCIYVSYADSTMCCIKISKDYLRVCQTMWLAPCLVGSPAYNLVLIDNLLFYSTNRGFCYRHLKGRAQEITHYSTAECQSDTPPPVFGNSFICELSENKYRFFLLVSGKLYTYTYDVNGIGVSHKVLLAPCLEKNSSNEGFSGLDLKLMDSSPKLGRLVLYTEQMLYMLDPYKKDVIIPPLCISLKLKREVELVSLFINNPFAPSEFIMQIAYRTEVVWYKLNACFAFEVLTRFTNIGQQFKPLLLNGGGDVVVFQDFITKEVFSEWLVNQTS